MKRIKIRYKALGAAAITACLMAANYMRPAGSVSARVSLTYEGAEDGLSPDGGRFNAYSIIGSDVLEAAGKAVGETLDPSQFHLAPSYSGNGKTYATDYIVSYYGPGGEPVLEAVLKTWKESFQKKAATNPAILDYEEPPEGADYLMRERWMERETAEIARYANERIKENGTWSSETGESFTDIKKAAENLQNVTLADLKAFIVGNGVSEDPGKLSRSLDYQNRVLQKTKDQADAQYRNRIDAINNLYDTTLFPTVSVPSVNNGQYYITTTRTGLDDIYDNTAEFLGTSLDVQRTITENTQILANLAMEPDASVLSDADGRLESAETEIRALADAAKKTDAEYQQTKSGFAVITADGRVVG